MKDRMEEVQQLALDSGLDPFPVAFEVVDVGTMHNVCAYGLPTRARHWTYGRSYDHQKTYGEMGLSKVYEIIVNNNPSYAFMLDTNTEMQNLFIAAHCFGHSDFFKNNIMFRDTNRNMVRHAADHAGRIENYIEKYGFEAVERIMDIGFALDGHIDWHKGEFRKTYPKRAVRSRVRKRGEFDDLFEDNNPSVIREIINDKFPPHPERDLLWFFINYAPLEDWEKDILNIMREEAFYFYPQMMTKILNEGWACLCEGSLVFSNQGLIDVKDLIKDKDIKVLDRNGNIKTISDTFTGSKKCLKIKTKKGYNLSGATKHGVLAYNKNNELVWRKLKDLSIGDKILMTYNQNCWGENIQALPHVDYTGKESAGFSLPKKLDEKTAKFLGYFFAEGHIGKRSVVLTNGDLNVANDMAKSIKDVFGYKCCPRKDDTRYRIEFYSVAAISLLEKLGLSGGSRNKDIPKQILLSPKNIVIEFLSAAFCGDGGAYEDGNILALSTGVQKNAEIIQLILLNLGIISSMTRQTKEGYDDCFQVWVCESTMKSKLSNLKTASGQKNQALLSMKYEGKNNFKWSFPLNQQLLDYMENGLSYTTQKEQKEGGINLYYIKKQKSATLNQLNNLKAFGVDVGFDNFFVDEIVEISLPFYAQVFDFTVPEGHEYQAQGFVNHNSFWHAELMFKYEGISPQEHMDFCRDHEKVVQPGGNPFRINPYFLGFRIFKDIEKRWDKLHEEGKSDITGREKIFQVRAEEDDISFIRNYLTADLVEELKLFTYGYVKDYPQDYDEEKYIEIKERMREEVVEALVSPLYNGGSPKISITGVGSEGTLIMRHDTENISTLDFKFAEKTLEYIWDLWAAPIELHAKNDDGDDVILYFDEVGFDIKEANEELDFDADDEEEDEISIIIQP